MSRTIRFTLALFLLTALPYLTHSQGKRGSQNRRDTRSRQQSVSLTFPPLRDYAHSQSVESSYDRFEGETSTKVETELTATLYLNASFRHSGQKLLSPPNSVVFIFKEISSYSLGIRRGDFIRNRGVILLIEGRPLRATGIYQNGGENENGWHEEYLGIELPVRTFLKLVNAQNVGVKVASMEADFSHENMEALRDLASRMNPNAKIEEESSTSPRENQSAFAAAGQEAKSISSELESLATQSNQLPTTQSQQKALPQTVSSLVGTWLLQVTTPDKKKTSFNVKFEEANGSYKCLSFEDGVAAEIRDCTITGSNFTFKLRNVPTGENTFDFTVMGSVKVNNIEGKVIVDHASGASVSLPLTGTRLTQ
jgi:hypothetical protein